MSHDSQAYCRTLYSLGHGCALWAPEPNDDLPPDYTSSGNRVGDVGLITDDGQFDYIFNICVPVDHPINLYNGVPPGFEPLSWDEKCTKKKKYFRPCRPISCKDSTQWELNMELEATAFGLPVGAGGGFGIKFRRERGAVVIPGPDGADRTNAANKAIFRKYACENGESWYKFVNEKLGREASNGAIYLITGFDKATSWENAVVYNRSTTKSCMMAVTTGGLGATSRFKLSNSAGREVSMNTRCSTEEGSQNQSLFVRGFRVSCRQGLFGGWGSGMKIKVQSTYGSRQGDILNKLPGPIPYGDHSLEPTSPSLSSSISGPSGLSFLTAGPSFTGEGSVFSSKDSVTTQESDDFVLESRIYHPLVAINDYILHTRAEATVVVTHDDEWASLLNNEEDDSQMPDDLTLITRLRNMMTVIVDHHGYATLVGRDPSHDATRERLHTPYEHPEATNSSKSGLQPITYFALHPNSSEADIGREVSLERGSKNREEGDDRGHEHRLQPIYGNPCDDNWLGSPGQGDGRLLPTKGRLREIFAGDIILRKEIWSQEMEVIERPLRTTNPFRARLAARAVKVQKKFYTAEIVQHQSRMFTMVSFEPENKKDREIIRMIWKQVYEAYSSHNSPLLTQVFGWMDADTPRFMLHDELANGEDIFHRYLRDRIVLYYLRYTNSVAINALRSDKTLSIPVSDEWSVWTFNLKTSSWQYDIASAAISLWDQDNSQLRTYHSLTPLRQEPHPKLNALEIVACVEEQLGDYLDLIASLGLTRNAVDLSSYARHGLLTLGSVIDQNRPGIIAHFSSTPSPEWHSASRTTDIQATYSPSVPWRIDIVFCKIGNMRVDLSFSWRLPVGNQLRTAYLGQSLGLYNDCYDAGDLSHIDDIGFSLLGTFSYDPKTCPAPVYLFVPPVPLEIVNGMYCIRHPLPSALFYWSSDPAGTDMIHEEDWETYGIPRLELRKWIGSSWTTTGYKCVDDYLRMRNYKPDGKQYARDHGYPELIRADPHDVRLEGHGPRRRLSRFFGKFNLNSRRGKEEAYTASEKERRLRGHPWENDCVELRSQRG
ncbi:SCF ubiquitin ligase complex subunit cdc4 [Marasmius tenuissimus]|nr:SCF ubiquitin ligase complex subunit cdc4 [Marasmius tenuissimus]